MSDGISDAARQTREALEYVRRKAEKEMGEQQKEYIITEQLLKDYYEGRLYYNEFLEQCRSRPHPAPATYLPISLDFQPICIDKPCIGQIDICPVDDECDSVKQCVAHSEWLRQNPDVAERNRKIVAQHDAAIARKAREDVLKELGTVLNSRIAKMENICSKNKTPLREGILMAYHEIEGWEMQQRNSIRSTPEQPKEARR